MLVRTVRVIAITCDQFRHFLQISWLSSAFIQRRTGSALTKNMFSIFCDFLHFFAKCILAINPSGMRDMETGVPPLKPAGPCVFLIELLLTPLSRKGGGSQLPPLSPRPARGGG